MAYFHATFREHIPSIQKHGLGGIKNLKKNFEFAKDGVYLSLCPALAVGFLLERLFNELNEAKDVHACLEECIGKTPREWYDSVCVIVIDDSRVRSDKLSPDDNTTSPDFWFHDGPIDVTSMPIISAKEAVNFSKSLTLRG